MCQRSRTASQEPRILQLGLKALFICACKSCCRGLQSKERSLSPVISSGSHMWTPSDLLRRYLQQHLQACWDDARPTEDCAIRLDRTAYSRTESGINCINLANWCCLVDWPVTNSWRSHVKHIQALHARVNLMRFRQLWMATRQVHPDTCGTTGINSGSSVGQSGGARARRAKDLLGVREAGSIP